MNNKRAQEQASIAEASYRAEHAGSIVERDLAAEELYHHTIKRLDRLQGVDSGPTDYERRRAAEDLRQRQLRGERVLIEPWMTAPNSVRR